MLGRIAVSAGLILAATAPFRAAMAEPTKADPNDASQVALGRQVYDAHCAACHGAKLEGQPNWRERRPDGLLPAPPHDAGGHTWHHPDQQLFDITKRGTAAIAGPGYRTEMREFGSLLSDAEIWAVLAYIKSTWPPDIRARQERMNAPHGAPPMPTVTPPQK
jgi:mono/diheme cytochrome c family protein